LKIAADSRGKVLNIASEKGALDKPEINSQAAIVVDADGQTIFEKNSTTTLPLASLTKIIALKIFLDQRPTLNQVVEYKIKDEEYNNLYTEPWRSSKLNVKEGEKMTIEDLVYSAAVGSANNAVESLVRVSGLERNVFIAKMNEFAAAIGAESAKFIEPTGLSADNKTSAADYAKIVKEALKNPFLSKVAVTPKYEFYSTDAKGVKTRHIIYNTNTFLRDGLFALENSLALNLSKTGYVDEVGHCLMTAAAKDGKQIIAIVLGAADKDESMSEVKDLILYGLRRYGNN
jgi:serine-type D-Ala-D-Ala endopeptidase (penicillin-binding protein 7)